MTKQILRKIATSVWTALITLAIILVIRISDPTFVESIRLRYFDTLIANKHPTENSVVTVNIDEESLNKYGQWPFPRGEYAKIINDLYSKNAGLVVWNVLMPDKDRSGQDSQLAKYLSEFPVVLSNVPSQQFKNLPKTPGSVVIGSEYLDRIVQYPGLIANIESLEMNAAGVGTTNTLPEIDGVNRRMPLVVSVNEKLYPSIAIEALRVASGVSTFQVKLNEFGVDKMRIPEFGTISTDNLGRIWIDWSQQHKSLSLEHLPDDFDGAIVIVGTSAAGLGNPVPTSIGSVWPQDMQATVISTMMNNVNIQRPFWADTAEEGILLFSCLLLLILTRWVYVGLASTFIIIMCIVIGSRFAFTEYLYLLDITALVSGIILVALHAYGIKFVNEFLQKQQIKKQFGSYVSPVMVERLQKNPELIKLGGEKKELSIVMTDLRGFTTLGESYGEDVEGLTKIMNDYMTAISDPVLKNDGCLIKFIGDASLHVHGAPLDDKYHAKNAVRTALEMIEAVDKFNEQLVRQGKPKIGMGAGVNTGPTLIGNIGSKARFGYDVLGDSVSTAARLEGQTKGYGVLLIIGPTTAKLVENDYFVIKLDDIAVKGKTIGLDIYTILPNNSSHAHRLKHNKMFNYYQSQQWWLATVECLELKGSFNGALDYYYDMMIKRIETYGEDISFPKDWDGILRATTK